MRKYKREPQVIISHDVLVETKCDLCSKIAINGNWETSTWRVAESEIEIKVRCETGASFPEGGNSEKYYIDICPECFKSKLIPWLESQGCKVKFKDWSW